MEKTEFLHKSNTRAFQESIADLFRDNVRGSAMRRALMGYLFIAPTVVSLLVFTILPIIASFGLSFFEWNVIEKARFVGLDNYIKLTHDTRVLRSFLTTAQIVILSVLLQIVVALLLALGVQSIKQRVLRYFFRTIFFIPILTSAASISIVLAYMFDQDFGVINYYLTHIGLPRIPWLNSPHWAMVAVIITYVWQQLGFMFIILTGGISSIPPEVLEAADVDGAHGWKKLVHIQIPMLSPTLLFAAVVGVIGALQIFEIPFVLTNGGPGDATRTVVMIIYESAFQNLQIGYGSAIAFILFVVILSLTAIQFILSRYWVFYQ